MHHRISPKLDMVLHHVLLFASLREKAGRETISIELPLGARAGDLLEAIAVRHPEIATLLPPCRVAIDHELVDADAPLVPGREIAVIPPVSGGHDGPRVDDPRVGLSDARLSLADVTAVVEHEDAGGLATFTGNVRRHSRGQRILHLDYEAYAPMAIRSMLTIVVRIEREITGARVAIRHRIGRVRVGEPAVVIAASAPHRGPAFEACRAAIEALKVEVPIWKREVSETGAAWIGQGP